MELTQTVQEVAPVQVAVRPGPVREHANAVVLGALGTGKMFLMTHLMKYGVLDLGGHVVLVDNEGPEHSSYRPLCELLQGPYIAPENNAKRRWGC